jgi:hypothetical protein
MAATKFVRREMNFAGRRDSLALPPSHLLEPNPLRNVIMRGAIEFAVMSVPELLRCDRPTCKACEAPMRAARLEPRTKHRDSELQVFVCTDCGLYQLVRPKLPTRSAA